MHVPRPSKLARLIRSAVHRVRSNDSGEMTDPVAGHIWFGNEVSLAALIRDEGPLPDRCRDDCGRAVYKVGLGADKEGYHAERIPLRDKYTQLAPMGGRGGTDVPLLAFHRDLVGRPAHSHEKRTPYASAQLTRSGVPPATHDSRSVGNIPRP